MKTKSKRNITNVTHSPCVKYILIMEFILKKDNFPMLKLL